MSFGRAVIEIMSLIVLVFVLYAYLLRLERQVMARLAPGCRRRIWAPLVDAARALTKPGLWPAGWRRLAWCGGALLAWAAAMGMLALAPMGMLAGGGVARDLTLVRLDQGLLVFLVLDALTLVGVLVGARSWGPSAVWEWSREVAWQGLRYGLAALVAAMGAAIVAGSLDLTRIAMGPSAWPLLIYQPLGALLLALAVLAGGRRMPFDLPGAGDQTLADFHLQHAGGPLALYHLAEYARLLAASALWATLYLAGPRGPGGAGPHWLLIKTVVVATMLLWLRRRWLWPQRQRLAGSGWAIVLSLGALNAALTWMLTIWRPWS